jgi:hypothetical protein
MNSEGYENMKIAPVTENWNEGEHDWSFVKDPRLEIESWEQREGLSLPAAYRKFMLQYNGGRVYPRLFHTQAALQRMVGPYEPTSDVTFVDPILPWADVEAHWRGETYERGVPPLHLVFAQTPGFIQLLMALTPENHGQILTWIHSSDDWGSENNSQLFPVANSFSEFLKGLYDEKDEDGYTDYQGWHMPLYDTLAKELQLE